MRKSALSLLLSLLVLVSFPGSTSSASQDFAAKDIYQRLFGSIAFFQASDGHCTAWSVRLGQWMTAAHCLEMSSPYLINGEEVREIKRDKKRDLALMEGPVVRPLDVATSPVSIGDEVIAAGWPLEWDNKKPLIFFLRVSVPDAPFGVKDMPDVNILDGTCAPGMSGGPVVNYSGKVIGQVEGYSSIPALCAMIRLEDIKAFLKK